MWQREKSILLLCRHRRHCLAQLSTHPTVEPGSAEVNLLANDVVYFKQVFWCQTTPNFCNYCCFALGDIFTLPLMPAACHGLAWENVSIFGSQVVVVMEDVRPPDTTRGGQVHTWAVGEVIKKRKNKFKAHWLFAEFDGAVAHFIIINLVLPQPETHYSAPAVSSTKSTTLGSQAWFTWHHCGYVWRYNGLRCANFVVVKFIYNSQSQYLPGVLHLTPVVGVPMLQQPKALNLNQTILQSYKPVRGLPNWSSHL